MTVMIVDYNLLGTPMTAFMAPTTQGANPWNKSFVSVTVNPIYALHVLLRLTCFASERVGFLLNILHSIAAILPRSRLRLKH